MSLASEEDIKDFADEVRSVFGDRLDEVILFGSYAKDEYVPGSDIDVMILVSEMDDSDEEKVWNIAWEFAEDKDLKFSPKIYGTGEFEDKVSKGYSFYKEVSDEGVRI